MLKFYSYRMSLVKVNTLFNTNSKTKEELFGDVLKNVISEKKVTFLGDGKKYFIYFDKELEKGVFSYELAKEESIKIPIEGSVTVEEDLITRTPFVYVIIDQNRQIILIQDKGTVFSDPNIARGKLEYFFTRALKDYFITTYLEPITDNKDFWKEVEQAESITELDITFVAPNMFRGRHKAEDLVREVYEDFNITEFDVKLKSKTGNLRLMKENLASFIKLVADGAGKFKLKTKRKGRKSKIETFRSDVNTQSMTFDGDTPSDVVSEKLGEYLENLDKLNEENQGNI